MDEDQWMYEGIMPEEVDMDYENEEECGVNEPHVDCSDAFNTSQVTMDKWMDITDMGYIIASRYNVILVSLSPQQNMMFFPLRSQPPGDPSVHRIICIGHVNDNHFIQINLKDCCPLPSISLLWSTSCHTQAKQ
ncbi:uncharacterized protein LOC114393300 isoform X2 [Glycine soja]|uniref:uncharacterized protein LOC114375649 isoform X3 n=1 Tax=Glycine soja TaxID=3848 RepID=UPI00103A26E6|nr:uncharacterized protein LOC114375649 isoform X3 [Glycine soja]XP_028210387.1 uncharacterized protein LOC114393300 isoform X2 [Glycine soja]